MSELVPLELIEIYFVDNYSTVNHLICCCKAFSILCKYSVIREYFVKKRIFKTMKERFKRKRYNSFFKKRNSFREDTPLWPP